MSALLRIFALLAVLGGFVALAASAAVPDAAHVAATATVPPGDEGALIAYGRDLIERTPQLLPHNVNVGMACEACHLQGGRKPKGGSFLGLYARFPQWNKRAHRFITLQDRLAECFLYSMNGTPPAYDSREMVALVAYIAFLSRGAPVGTGFDGQRYEQLTPARAPNVTAGAATYTKSCAACHGADGAGNAGTFPPLWGARSFNDGAGMHRLPVMAGFVRRNMPYGSAPDTLGVQQAIDVAAYVLSHPRPHFNGARAIVFPAQAARTF